MKESFFQAVWQYRLFDWKNLKTTQGENLIILNPGTLNHDSGPDFFNAKIQIGTLTWAGNIELHIRSSDWKKHAHEQDINYGNIILLVVAEDDEPLANVPTLELKDHLKPELFDRYLSIIQSLEEIPCARFLSNADLTVFNLLSERMMVERLENKCLTLEKVLIQNNGNWEDAFYKVLAGNFGFKTNKEPFEYLSKQTPIQVLGKERNNPLQPQALLMGQAGFLQTTPTDSYQKELKAIYSYQQKKHNLEPIPVHLWKFMRTRPANFPTLRLSQFASLLFKTNKMLMECINFQNIADANNFFDIEAENYWQKHIRFGVEGGNKSTKLGTTAINLLLINTVIPFMFYYGKENHQELLCENALELLKNLEPENNKITRLWQKHHKTPYNAAESQALIELYTNHCLKKKCLNCTLGISFLK